MKWSDYIHPLHPEGRKFVLAAVVVTILLYMAAPDFIGHVALILTLFIAYFFRDPDRYIPDSKGIVLSPADGRVQNIVEAAPPRELDMGAAPLTRISIFLSVIDVHVNRAPVDGVVERAVYVPGKFINASLDKASEENERQLMQIRIDEGGTIGLSLIAGLVARRIVCDVEEGQSLSRGERIAIIRFGSRADIYLAPGMTPSVAIGQSVLGGETVLARSAADAVAPQAVRK